ncbi:[LysW]-lysine hydrolase [Halobaculum sp. MBLA0147]|uniref:[LysW]-lysine hydrolase n=1 Tax=Halobaculum sp. MBLA0147 TaxID=3079934 RepID=UPI0035255564
MTDTDATAAETGRDDGDGETEAGRESDRTETPDSGADTLAVDESALTTPARELLADLVATPSVSGDEEAVADRLAAFFADRDRSVRIDAVGNVRAPAPDAAPGEDVLLTSHLDTVPGEVPVRVERVPVADARWGGDPAVDDSRETVPELWGRGSVDATGPLVALAAAAVETGASFVGVVGEETDSRGARHLVDDRPAPAAVVNGEPSGWDAVTLGYRGFLRARYEVTTDAVHSSRPEPNAIQHATDWWRRVSESVGDTAETAPGSVFESVTATPVRIDGGPTDDGHAVAATVAAEFRVPPTTTPDAIRDRVAAETDRGDLTWTESIPPTTASPRTELARAFRVAVRGAGGDVRLLRKTGTADANLFAAAWDAPVVTYGPGDSALDHTADERVPLPELDRAAGVAATAVERLR